MGMNYFLRTNICAACGRYDQRHIGASSAGWCFALHVYPEEGIGDLRDWERLWSQGVIVDEEGQELTPTEMMGKITVRSWDQPRRLRPQELARAGAEPGPNNLFRHRLDGWRCVGHGPGTWDLLQGEFS